MLAKAFVVAMTADIARSDYAKPTLIRSRSREWLIACRWGPDGEYLSIATAGAILASAGSPAARERRTAARGSGAATWASPVSCAPGGMEA